jgi:hypothetical protein
VSSKPENTFIGTVNDRLPIKKRKASTIARRKVSDESHIHYEKMNNPYRGGTADSWYSGLAGDLWVEFKYLPRVPKRGVVDPLKLLKGGTSVWLLDVRSGECSCVIYYGLVRSLLQSSQASYVRAMIWQHGSWSKQRGSRRMIRLLTTAVKAAGLTYSLLATGVLITALAHEVYAAVKSRK